MHAIDSAATLAAIPLFGGLTNLRAAELAAASRLQRCSANEQVVREGDEGYTMYVILKGRVSVSRLNELGERVLFHELSAGEFFGEMSLLAGTRRTADVITVKPSQLLVIEREAFVRCVLGTPQVAMRIISHLCGRIVQSDTARISKRTVRQRLVDALLNLAMPLDGQDGLALEISKTALADRILARRETVSRELSQLAREGHVNLSGRKIRIPEPANLQALAE